MISLIQECPMCGEQNKITMQKRQYEELHSRTKPIQEIFQEWNPMEREFVKSGYCPDCQELLFGSNYKSDRIIRGWGDK